MAVDKVSYQHACPKSFARDRPVPYLYGVVELLLVEHVHGISYDHNGHLTRPLPSLLAIVMISLEAWCH